MHCAAVIGLSKIGCTGDTGHPLPHSTCFIRILQVPSQIDPNFKGMGTKNNCVVVGGHTEEQWELLIQYYLSLAEYISRNDSVNQI